MKEIVPLITAIFNYITLEKSLLKKLLKFIVICIVVISFVNMVLWGYNKLNFTKNINNRVETLERLSTLDIETIKTRPELKKEYDRIIEKINVEYTPIKVSYYENNIIKKNIKINTTKNDQIIKFISGGFWMFLLSLFSIKIFNGKNQVIGGFVFLILMGGIFGWISTLIPTFIKISINYIGVPIIEFLIILIIYFIFDPKNKNKTREVPEI